MKKINEEFIREWLRRLRSGKIPQAQFHLGGADGSRCCLGVACDIAVEMGVITPPVLKLGGVLEYDRHTAILPEKVVEAAGLPSSDPVVSFRSHRMSDLNDLELSFSQIADIIEENIDFAEGTWKYLRENQ